MSQRYGWQSTTDDVLEGIDLTGKRVLVTGTSAGLGIETARALVARGAYVVGTARDLAKGRKATTQIDAGGFELVEMDLASLGSVRACAGELVTKGDRFDAVIANAGVMTCPEGKTADGFETQFGTNHLGHFLFLNRVAPLLNHGARVVCLSSIGHRLGDVDLEDPNFERQPYSESIAYARSKTANALFAVEFDRRHKVHGIRATAVHPGGIQTELARHVTPEVMAQFQGEIKRHQPDYDLTVWNWKSIPQGAATSVWAGFRANADTVGGRYCEDCRVAEVDDGPGFTSGVKSYALSAERAKALWATSERLVGETF